MIKRVIGLLLCMCMLLSCTCFAAAVTTTVTTTTTSYDMTTGTIEVTTKVTGTSASEQVTFLAFKNEGNNIANITDRNIVFVDQKASDGSDLEFSFTTNEVNIGSKVLVGGSGSRVDSDVPGVVILKDNANKILATGTVADTYATGITNVTLDKAINISSMTTINGATPGNDLIFFINGKDLKLSSGAIATDKATIIEVVESSFVAPVLLGVNKTTLTADKAIGGAAINAVSGFGNVKTLEGEYGIVFSTNPIADNAEIVDFGADSEHDIDLTKAVAFKALGKNADGDYVVQIQSNDFDSTTVYARAYYKNTSGYTLSAQKGSK